MALSELLQQQQQHDYDDASFAIDDALYCQEDYTFDNIINEDEDFNDDEDMINNHISTSTSTCNKNLLLHKNNNNINNNINDDDDRNGPTPLVGKLLVSVYEQDLFWEEGELTNLLSKEETRFCRVDDEAAAGATKEAVDWMLKVHAHYNFSLITALLAVNYFDRFIFKFEFQKDKQLWMSQLSAVACLSLAAKVEETHVPLLVDFQVEDCKYVFEAKTIQRMEILVLSTLQWKMHPVTPYSFLDYLTRRMPLKNFLCQESFRRCERILLATVVDSRFMDYLPSVMAAATILYVIDCFEPYKGDDYQNQLLRVLGIAKEKVEECCQLIYEVAAESIYGQSNKRKLVSRPGSPNGVIDVTFSSDSSNDSWAVASVPSSPEHLTKKLRTSKDRHLQRFNHSSVDFFSIHH